MATPDEDWSKAVAEEVLRMRKSQELRKHVDMQSFAHLRFRHAEIAGHVAEDARLRLARKTVAVKVRLVLACSRGSGVEKPF